MESELSVFIDESGDVGRGSEFYIVALVFHNQRDALARRISNLSNACLENAKRDDPFHFTPLLRGRIQTVIAPPPIPPIVPGPGPLRASSTLASPSASS